MADDRDLAGQLPAAPPPRPDRREAAIDAAVARFGGKAAPARPAPPRQRWVRYRPQIGAVAAAVLVVTIGLPVWQSGRIETPPPRPAAPVAVDRAAVVPAPAPVVVARRDAVPPVPVQTPTPTARADAAAEVQEAPAAPDPAPAAARPGAPPPPVVIQSVTTPPPAYVTAPPPPAIAAPSQVAAMPATEDMIVTGARVARSRAPDRGDWTRCTVDDPRRALADCRARFGLATPGVRGRAQALTGDGVLRAWAGDRDGALATLDRAIAVAPTADALLNRALLRMAAGDDAGALTDLDRAVRRDPRDARGYHYRGVVQARLGRADRAAADARRAAALDKQAR